MHFRSGFRAGDGRICNEPSVGNFGFDVHMHGAVHDDDHRGHAADHQLVVVHDQPRSGMSSNCPCMSLVALPMDSNFPPCPFLPGTQRRKSISTPSPFSPLNTPEIVFLGPFVPVPHPANIPTLSAAAISHIIRPPDAMREASAQIPSCFKYLEFSACSSGSYGLDFNLVPQPRLYLMPVLAIQRAWARNGWRLRKCLPWACALRLFRW